VSEVVVGELSSPPIFQPLVADLIAADLKLPELGRDALEGLSFCPDYISALLMHISIE